MHILVTGAAGFIGFHLVRRLLDRGDTVVGLDNLNNYYDVRLKRDRLMLLVQKKNFSFIEANLEDIKNNLPTTPNVKIEKIDPLTNNLEDDQKLSNALKQIEKLKEEIKKQSQVIQKLKSN